MENYTKAQVLIQALPYIKKFSGKTIVVKYGGNAMINEALKENVIKDLVLMKCIGINIVIVHGGGPFITDLSNKLNIQSQFINGLRYTDKDTIEVVQMVLAGKVNKEIVALLQKHGENALGITGIDGNLLKAKPICSDVDLGYVGDITKVNVKLVEDILQLGYIPVVGSIASGDNDGNLYNINADTCAAKIASALKAEKLILLTDVDGVCLDPKDKSTLISTLKLHEIPKYEQDGIIKGGMIPKIECCVEAIRNGVKTSHIINGTTPNSLLLEVLSDEGIGTMIY